MEINYNLQKNGKGVLTGVRIFTGIGNVTLKFTPPEEYYAARAYAIINDKTYPLNDWTAYIDDIAADNDELEISVVLENSKTFKCETLRALIGVQTKELATSVNSLLRFKTAISGDLTALAARVKALEDRHKTIL